MTKLERLNKKNIASGLVGLAMTTAGFIAKIFYREYVAINNINDFGLADSLPSFLYVIGFSQLLLIKPSRYPYFIIIVVALGSVAFEFRQYSLSGSLDFGDIFASLAGGAISLIIFRLVTK